MQWTVYQIASLQCGAHNVKTMSKLATNGIKTPETPRQRCDIVMVWFWCGLYNVGRGVHSKALTNINWTENGNRVTQALHIYEWEESVSGW